jgi:hypothetical protein
MYLISEKELTDDSDTVEVHERCTGIKASVVAFVTWLIVLVLLDRVQVEMNIFLSLFCGFTIFLGIFRLLKRVDRKTGQ